MTPEISVLVFLLIALFCYLRLLQNSAISPRIEIETIDVRQNIITDLLWRRCNYAHTQSGLRISCLSLAAGNELRTAQAMLGHSSIVLTADTDTSVLPCLSHQAAEVTADLVL